jgi:hypothetical protein
MSPVIDDEAAFDHALGRYRPDPDPEPRLRGDILVRQVLTAILPHWLVAAVSVLRDLVMLLVWDLPQHIVGWVVRKCLTRF